MKLYLYKSIDGYMYLGSHVIRCEICGVPLNQNETTLCAHCISELRED